MEMRQLAPTSMVGMFAQRIVVPDKEYSDTPSSAAESGSRIKAPGFNVDVLCSMCAAQNPSPDIAGRYRG